VQKVVTELPGAADDGGPLKVEMLTYNGGLVGPTIRIRRGSRVRIRVSNQLAAGDEDRPIMNAPHGLCTTNLHTHGLHVSPQDPADNVFREIKPGQEFTYTYDIPANHPSGTNWYHPHKHGSTAYQVTNGMAGALIVEGDADKDLEAIPEIAAARDQVFVLQQFRYRIDSKGVGRVDSRDIYSKEEKPFLPGCDIPDVPGEFQLCTAVNGVVVPTYVLAPGEVQRWRFIHAGREEQIYLTLRDQDGIPTGRLKFTKIAMDGLTTGTLESAGTEQQPLRLNPGNRCDVLVKAPLQEGVYFVHDMGPPDGRGLRRVKTPPRNLVKVLVRGTTRDMTLPKPEQAARCKPMESIQDKELVNPRKPRRISFESDDQTHTFNLNDKPFDERDGLQPPPVLGTAEEWLLESYRDPHVFHIHVNPFEVLEKGKDGSIKREWRDTVYISPELGPVTIRLRFQDFPGKTVMHCHILDHEDQGMMSAVEIVSAKARGAKAPGRERDGNVRHGLRRLTEVSLPAPQLRLRDDRAKLSALEGQATILVFFRGMGCIHCTKELRELIREAVSLARTDIVLVAISSEPIDDLASAVKSLGAAGQDWFHLVVDRDRQSFRNFGCFKNEPQHGLVLSDRSGTIRYRYVGETPFDDAKLVLRLAKEISADVRK
jgi:FtsP/CotA-like multicopper oxidase with cupredoxin domain/peroxiredoxin